MATKRKPSVKQQRLFQKPRQNEPPPQRSYPKETKSLARENQEESLDLGFASLRIYYVDYGQEDPYWTWSIGRAVGGQYPNKIEAKWAGAYHGYLLIQKALEDLRIPYEKAVKYYGLEP